MMEIFLKEFLIPVLICCIGFYIGRKLNNRKRK